MFYSNVLLNGVLIFMRQTGLLHEIYLFKNNLEGPFHQNITHFQLIVLVKDVKSFTEIIF